MNLMKALVMQAFIVDYDSLLGNVLLAARAYIWVKRLKLVQVSRKIEVPVLHTCIACM